MIGPTLTQITPPPDVDTFYFSEGAIITPTGARCDLTPQQASLLGRLMKRMTGSEFHAVTDADCAEAVWGPGKHWPDQWKSDLHSITSDMRRRMRTAGVVARIARHVGFGLRLAGRMAAKP